MAQAKRHRGYRAFFSGNAGKVDVQDNVSSRKIDFIADGYMTHSSNNSKFLANDSASIKVDSTYHAEISAEITGTSSISKRSFGTLILSHDNSDTWQVLFSRKELWLQIRATLYRGRLNHSKGRSTVRR
jgi:hypothetical protein